MSGAPSEIRERARALALVLGIQPGTYAGREQEAALIMAHLALMPAVRDHNRRRLYGNEILQNANQLLPFDRPANRAFAGHVQMLVAQMQTLPAWWNKVTISNSQLVRDYKRVEWAVWLLKKAGMTGVASLTGGMVKTGVKDAQALSGRPVPAGQQPPGRRGVAGAAVRGAATGAVNSFTGGMSGRVRVVWVIGSLTYVGAMDNQRQLTDEINRRYQERKLSAAEYRSCFGSSVPLPEQFHSQR